MVAEAMAVPEVPVRRTQQPLPPGALTQRTPCRTRVEVEAPAERAGVVATVGMQAAVVTSFFDTLEPRHPTSGSFTCAHRRGLPVTPALAGPEGEAALAAPARPRGLPAHPAQWAPLE